MHSSIETYLSVIEGDLNREWQDITEPENCKEKWTCSFSANKKNIVIQFSHGNKRPVTFLTIRAGGAIVEFGQLESTFYLKHISLFAKYIPELLLHTLP